MKIVAVDPGFKSVGVVITDEDTMVPEVLKVLHTVKASKKAIKKIRVADDDCRRLKELQDAFCALLPDDLKYVLAIETFSSFKGGYKAALGYAMAITIANSHRRPVFPFVPQDIKREMCGKMSASKQEVQDKVFGIFGINEKDFNKGDREHIADALALTLLVKKEIEKLRKIVGEVK